MLIQATKILLKPVIAQNEAKEVGKLSEIIIDPQNYRIVAFLIYKLLSPKIVSEVDVLEIKSDGIVINSEESLSNPSEIVRVKQILDRDISIIDSKAITESKKSLGRVEDFLIDTESGTLTKFYIKGGLLSPSIILPSEKAIKIEPGEIIFEDDVLGGGKATSVAAI